MEPEIRDADFSCPVVEITLGLNASKDRIARPSGSAVIIAPMLAITATHVIADFVKRFDGVHLDPSMQSGYKCSYDLELFQIVDGGKTALNWKVTKIWASLTTDICALRLDPVSGLGASHKFRQPVLNLVPPRETSIITAFGYANPGIKIEEGYEFWDVEPKISTGTVKEVHLEKRDISRLHYPCFQTNAPFIASMSGGPVFDESGMLCGIICSNLEPSDCSEEHASYVSLLYPLMGLELDMERRGEMDCKESYPIIDLAAEGYINVKGFEFVKLERDDSGKIRNVGIYLPKGI